MTRLSSVLADGAATVTGSNLTWVVIVAVIALLALAVAGVLVREVLAASQGTAKMQEIAKAVQEGAAAYLRRQFRTLGVFVVIIFFVLLLLPADGTGVRWGRSIFFLLGAAIVVLIYKSNAPSVLEGFGFGAALLALFMRVGGGIYTKAADVGADLVGKVEQGIPEDDPRNAATIADNVGDNVGDCAGMAADLFESYAVMLVASLILGKVAFGNYGLVFPLLVQGLGIMTAVAGIYAVTPRSDT